MVPFRLNFLFTFVLFIVQNVHSASVKRVGPHPSAEYSVDVSMPGIKPDMDEQYTCFAVEVLQPGFIVEFVPTASANRVHHMLLYGCEEPGRAPGEYWNCMHSGYCKSASKILYAWARNAPAMSLPENVGVPVGKAVGVHYFVLQMHYSTKFTGNAYDYSGVSLQMSSQKPQFVAGIYLFVTGDMPIPAETKSFSLNMSCSYDGDTVVHPFAYRTHTHALGRIVSAYKYRGEKWTKIGKGNPQWPQRFYPVDKPVEITKGDMLAAQCIYDSSDRHEETEFGAHGNNEMCNFYMYYYVDADRPSPFGGGPACAQSGDPKLFAKYPLEASTPFSGNIQMTQMGMQSSERFGAVETKNWPSNEVLFGQIAGLTFDRDGNLIVFHRCDRVWNDETFDLKYNYRQRTNGPIMDNTILTMNNSKGTIVKRYGKGFFYMPHGIFSDSNGFLWTTDVAMHQVHKFDPKQEKLTPLLTLGKEFQPGSDTEHFCQPSGVAVTSTGLIFVSDGYCNNRIMKFDKNGKFLSSFGEASSDILPNGSPKIGTFNLPHALTLNEAKEQLVVADRENGRVQIFDFNGTPLSQIVSDMFGGSVYGVAYCLALDLIYAVNGPTLAPKEGNLAVFAFDGNTKRLMFSWQPLQGAFQKPHTLAVNSDCSNVYVGEIGPNKLWKFDITSSGRSNLNRAVDESSSVKKPQSAIDTEVIKIDRASWPQLILILSLAVAVPVLLIAVVCCCVRFKKQGGFKQLNLSLQGNYHRNGKTNGKVPLLTDAFGGRSHKGFQPLRTEDIDAMDDLTDESDTEDTLYTSAPIVKNGPLKA